MVRQGAGFILQPEVQVVEAAGCRGQTLRNIANGTNRTRKRPICSRMRIRGIDAVIEGVPTLRPAGKVSRFKPAIGDEVGLAD